MTAHAGFSGLSATTLGFELGAVRYPVDASATWGGGSVQLEKQSADGQSWSAVGAAFTANGFQILDLAGGQYRLAVATATEVAVTIVPTPELHEAAVLAAEGARQVALAAASTQAEVRAADATYQRACLTSAVANNPSVAGFHQTALRELGLNA
jgi:hypothetical protein